MNWTHWTHLFTSFDGRINREPFWIACGILVAVEVTAQLLAYGVESERLNVILDLAFAYPEFAVAVKRSNDRNLSPWVVALFFAINVALDLFTLWIGTIDTDDPVNELILIPFTRLAVILISELGFRPGTNGPNPHGPDPLSGKA